MAERERWVAKAEAAREMEVSISTLDRMIRRGEVEVRREGRRVYVRMEGPERVSDEELLRRALRREGKLQRRLLESDRRAQALERERDEAVYAAAADRQALEEMEETYEKERACPRKADESAGLQARPIRRCGAARGHRRLLTWRLVLSV